MAENKTRNKIVLGLGAALVLLVVALMVGRKRGPAVQIASVMREDLSSAITSNGRVEPIAPMTAHAEFPTFVSKVSATEGQLVHKGQTILVLDSADVRAQLAQAQAELLVAQATLHNAQAGAPEDAAQVNGALAQAQAEVKNLERTHASLEQLVAKQAATKDELAQNEADLAKARATLETAEQHKKAFTLKNKGETDRAALIVSQDQSQVQSLEEKVQSATVVATQDGTLYSLPVHQGDYVKVGDVLAVMADLSHVRVRAYVDEPDLGALEPNQDVEVTWDAKAGTTWTGHTEQIPKQVVPRGERSVGELLCSVDNQNQGLLPNVNVDVRILVKRRPNVITVPRAAVFDEQNQHYVFVFNDGIVHRRIITIGIASASKYEVLSGLETNDQIAIPGDQKLVDGMSVRVME